MLDWNVFVVLVLSHVVIATYHPCPGRPVWAHTPDDDGARLVANGRSPAVKARHGDPSSRGPTFPVLHFMSERSLGAALFCDLSRVFSGEVLPCDHSGKTRMEGPLLLASVDMFTATNNSQGVGSGPEV